MMTKYRHKRTGIIVELNPNIDNGTGMYVSASKSTECYLPKGIVEQSAEWEEIVPIIDFFGAELDSRELAYHVFYKDDMAIISNNRTPIEKSKIIATFKKYEDACQFHKLFIFLNKSKDLLVTQGGNPSQYLKNIIKTIR